MPKGSPELTNARREEIISACKTLYKDMSFKEITIMKIAEYTTFSRASIYNYFETKEEIFLSILQKEYELWNADLKSLTASRDSMTKDEIAKALASSLEKRRLLLKLMSMNHYDMEENSREERLCEFKVAYGESLKAVDALLQKFCADMDERARRDFLYSFFPFIYGIYPYTIVTEKQKRAMEKAKVGFTFYSIYDIAYTCARKLLEG
ncbi:MAG: TetR family transcriptional regulator [Ruminococcus sp.]|nr:TetR family transcriptional regulator [Ruminococcus sp.]